LHDFAAATRDKNISEKLNSESPERMGFTDDFGDDDANPTATTATHPGNQELEPGADAALSPGLDVNGEQDHGGRTGVWEKTLETVRSLFTLFFFLYRVTETH
jgi:hypothetical protein